MRIGILSPLCVLSLLACGGATVPPGSAVESDGRIDTALREELRARNERVLAAVAADDPAALRELLAPEITRDLDGNGGLESLVAELREGTSESRFVPFHDYHIPLTGSEASPFDLRLESGPFGLQLEPRGKALFVSLLESREGFRDRVLGLVWSRDDGGWRLRGLRAGTLRISGRDAADWYDEARALAGSELPFPAGKRLSVAADLLRPLAFLRYSVEDEVVALQQQVKEALAESYSFPWEIDNVEGSPTVYRIRPLFLQGQLSHAVQYVTRLPLEERALGPEVDRLHEELTRRIPGFCEAVDNVAYSALAEPPLEAGRDYRSVGIVASCDG